MRRRGKKTEIAFGEEVDKPGRGEFFSFLVRQERKREGKVRRGEGGGRVDDLLLPW